MEIRKNALKMSRFRAFWPVSHARGAGCSWITSGERNRFFSPLEMRASQCWNGEAALDKRGAAGPGSQGPAKASGTTRQVSCHKAIVFTCMHPEPSIKLKMWSMCEVGKPLGKKRDTCYCCPFPGVSEPEVLGSAGKHPAAWRLPAPRSEGFSCLL